MLINGTAKTVMSADLEKQGERSIDQIKVMLPANVGIDINDKLLYLQDFADLNNLSAIYNFQQSVKDESGNANHGTGTDITYGSDTSSSAEFDAHVAGIRSGEIEVDESKKLIKHKIIGGKGAE